MKIRYRQIEIPIVEDGLTDDDRRLLEFARWILSHRERRTLKGVDLEDKAVALGVLTRP